MKVTFDPILGRLRKKDAATATGGGLPDGFETWEDYINYLISTGSNSGVTRWISGSIVWLQNLDFDCSPLVYAILGKRTTAPAKLLTIPANAVNNPMFAVIYGDIFGNIGYILGTPAASPAIPHVNDSTQILLMPVYIPALGTAPADDPNSETGTINTEVIYNENIEWTTAKTEETDLSINLAATANPAKDVKHIRMAIAAPAASQFITGDLIATPLTISHPVTTITDQTILNFYLSDLFDLNKSDVTSGTTRVLTWLNWLQSNSLAVHLVNDETGDIYQFRVTDNSVFENWQIAALNFAANIPQQLNIEIASGNLPAGTYTMNIDRIMKYRQIYTVQAANSVFNPAAALISFTRATAINAKNGNILLNLCTSKAWETTTALLLQLYNGTALVGSLTLFAGAYNYNPAITVYQNLIIPVADFNLIGSDITKLVIKPVNNWPNNVNFDIDYILLQTGTNGTPETSFEIITDKSVTGNGTSKNPIILVGDETAPASLKYYGTNAAGVKGWHSLPTPDNTYIVYNETELLAAYANAISYVGKSATIYIGATITLTANRSFIRAYGDANISFVGIGITQVIEAKNTTLQVNFVTFRNISFSTTGHYYFTVNGGYVSLFNCRWIDEQLYNVDINNMKVNIKITGTISNGTGQIFIDGLYHANSMYTYINNGDIQPFIIENATAWTSTQNCYINILRMEALKDFDRFSKVLIRATSNLRALVTGDLSWFYHTDQVWPGNGFILSTSILLKKGSIDDLRADYIPAGTIEYLTGIDSNKKMIKAAAYPATPVIAYNANPTHDFNTGKHSKITLTGDVTTYTLANVPDGGKGTIAIIQDATGGFGIAAIAHAGLTVQYLGGQAPTAANINSAANGHTLLNYDRIGDVIYINFGGFN